MRKILILLLVSWCLSQLVSADLTTVDGKVYSNAEVKKCAAGMVCIVYDKGERKIPLDVLPENFIAALSPRQRSALRNGSDLKLVNGTVYKNCFVKSLGGRAVTLKHDQGIVMVMFNDLPRNYRATFSRKHIQKIFSVKQTSAAGSDIIGKTADGKIVYSGLRGGRYYINDKGNRVYLRKNVEVKAVGSETSNDGQQ